jgi:peptidyl-prolyl cis-trans isomerase B (cyclophilin B)
MALLIGCSAINPNPSQTAGGSGSSGSSGASGEGGEGADASGEAGRKNPVAVIEMQDGKKIEVELYPDIAPNTVNNFISLANSGFYDGVIFHRVIPGFMIQGGDPEGTGGGGPGYGIKGEFSNNDFPNGLKHTRGVISMARRGNPINPKPFYDTAGSQFFIMVADSPSLDNDYAAFGKAVSGMDVADAIVNTPTDSGDKPLSEQKIKTITVDTFGVDYPEPETISE